MGCQRGRFFNQHWNPTGIEPRRWNSGVTTTTLLTLSLAEPKLLDQNCTCLPTANLWLSLGGIFCIFWRITLFFLESEIYKLKRRVGPKVEYLMSHFPFFSHILAPMILNKWLIKLSTFLLIMLQGWKALYISQHRRMAVAISSVVEFVRSSLNNGSLESEYYLKAIADLALIPDIGFLDVQFFLFSRNHSAIINLIGLHYSIASLHVLVSYVLLMILLSLNMLRVERTQHCFNSKLLK